MITLFSLPDHDQIAAQLQKINIRQPSISPAVAVGPSEAKPGQVLPIVAPVAGIIVVPAQWGTLDLQTRKSVYFANAEGQRYGYRGIVLVTHIEMQFERAGKVKNVRLSDPTGALLNIGAVFKPESSNGPLSCKIMLCHSSEAFGEYGRFQPVLLADRHCSDFLNTQRDAILYQKSDPRRVLKVEASSRAAEFSSLIQNPFGMSGNDPRASDPPTLQIPNRVVVL